MLQRIGRPAGQTGPREVKVSSKRNARNPAHRGTLGAWAGLTGRARVGASSSRQARRRLLLPADTSTPRAALVPSSLRPRGVIRRGSFEWDRPAREHRSRPGRRLLLPAGTSTPRAALVPSSLQVVRRHPTPGAPSLIGANARRRHRNARARASRDGRKEAPEASAEATPRSPHKTPCVNLLVVRSSSGGLKMGLRGAMKRRVVGRVGLPAAP